MGPSGETSKPAKEGREIMKALIACEESQEVCKAFRNLGHEAYSCDIQPPSGGRPEWHIQGDVLKELSRSWDIIIAFPPCTYLCSSGMHWTTRGLRDPQLTEDALEFVRAILDAPCDKIALENPVGCISSRIRKPDQIIQPWMFGDDASKKTCLWLKGLPPLQPTSIVEGRRFCCGAEITKICPVCEGLNKPAIRWDNQTPSGQNKLGPSKDRAKLRSKTYPGIAAAMAQQWGLS
jgi:hypothetical protein